MPTCQNCQTNFTPVSPKNKKFCSKQCCKASHNKANRKPEGWVRKGVSTLSAREDRKNRYLALQKTHITVKEFELTYDIDFINFEIYCRKHLDYEIPSELVNVNLVDGKWCGGITRFISRSIAKQVGIYKGGFRKDKQLPDGYVNREYIWSTLDVCELTMDEYKKNYSGYPKRDPSKNAFSKTDADSWIQYVQEQLVLREQQRLADRQQRQINRQNQEQEQQIARLAARLWRQHRDLLKREDNLQKKIAREALRAYRLVNPPKPVYKIKYRREGDWTSIDAYEDKVAKRLADPDHNFSSKSYSANKHYHDQQAVGNILSLSCSKCSITKPFYDFHTNTRSSTGRFESCKSCIISKANKNKTKKPKNSSAFIAQFATAIKKALAEQNKQYISVGSKEIWDALPYTKDEFIAHIQSNMEPWMTWGNNTRPKFNEKTWHLDHIIPKSSFVYTSLADTQFLQCWSLSNLKPIEAIVNIAKNDMRDLNSSMMSKIKNAVVRGGKTKHWDRFFDFSAQQYRLHLESQFTDGMNWSNHGKIWQIDHIIPCASLPWNEVGDDNYKKLWSYDNLQPLLSSQNAAKSSKHDNKKHFLKK